MSRECPLPGCKKQLPDRLLLCAEDWRLVPKPLRDAVFAAYKGGRGVGTPELAEAQRAAIRAAAGAGPPLPGWLR